MNRVIYSVMAVLLLTACRENPAVSREGAADKTGKQSMVIDERLVTANTRFGFKLFGALTKGDAGENLFISPSSVAMALAMTYNGADSTTRDAMASCLEIQGMSTEDVNHAFSELKSLLEMPDSGVTLSIANSLWARQGLPFKEDFLQRNRDFYGARVTSLDFTDPGAAPTINAWVSDNTKGKIPQIVTGPIDQATILFLINAIYFKGAWTKAFDTAETRNDLFHLPKGKTKPIRMMHQFGDFQYCRGAGFQAICLPYGSKRIGMYVFLPDSGQSLSLFLRGLDQAKWSQWMTQLQKAPGNIFLPRFKMEYESSLNGPLKSLGMGIAFDPGRANFSRMFPVTSDQNVFISNVKHKTFIDVNEEGTEAAAATSVEVGITSIRIEPERFTMVVDRPFFLAIRDNQTGEILFMGTVVDP